MSNPVSMNTTAVMRTAGRTRAHRSLKTRMLHALACPCMMACLLLPAHAAHAEVTARDLQIVARTLGFLDPPLTGEVDVGIVFDAGSTRSSNEAQSINRLLGSGLTVGNLRLKPVLVPLARAASANVHFFLLAEASGEGTDQLRPVVQNRQLPCLTTDLEQVRNGNCAVGIQSAPKVEILVNREAAAASGVGFASVFRMMIKEL